MFGDHLAAKTALFVWEIGGGLGHVAPLAAVARELTSRSDLKPVFILREPVFARRFLAGAGGPVLPAPVIPHHGEMRARGASYAQTLVDNGYTRPGDLQLAVAAWHDLFGIFDPALIVADHAPTAILAARGKIPVLGIGTGFTMPPDAMREFPSLTKDVQPPVFQGQIRECINAVLKNLGQPAIEHLPELLKCGARAVFSLPHLDPYGTIRNEKLLGHYESGLAPSPPEKNGVFFYSRSAEPRLELMVEGLAGSGLPISAYITGADTAAKMFLKTRGATVFDDPPALADILRESSLVVSHGGAGLTSAALQVGRPQVILPIHVESEITALRIAALGSGMVVEDVEAGAVTEAVKTVSEVRLFQEHATAISEQIQQLGLPANPPATAAEMALNLI